LEDQDGDRTYVKYMSRKDENERLKKKLCTKTHSDIVSLKNTVTDLCPKIKEKPSTMVAKGTREAIVLVLSVKK
jgi:hypothetical protein